MSEDERAYHAGLGAPGHDSTAQEQKILPIEESILVTGDDVNSDQFLKELARNRAGEGWSENDI